MAARLLDSTVRAGTRMSIDLIDPAPRSGPGLAYATEDPRHLLNVPAGRMSALPDDPDDFVRWLTHHEHRRVDPGEFVSRGAYGTYLQDTLARSVEAAGGFAAFRRRHARVVAVDRSAAGAERVRLCLDEGGALDADAVVLALGNLAPSCRWVPEGLRQSPHFVADPWQVGALDGIAADQDVLLVGTGLTMCDVAHTLGIRGRTVHAVSRNGLMPQPHVAASSPNAALNRPGPIPASHDLGRLRRQVLHRAAWYRRHHGDWRPAIDELRPHVSELWQQLSLSDREVFLSGAPRVGSEQAPVGAGDEPSSDGIPAVRAARGLRGRSCCRLHERGRTQ
ncbi:FAD/NAD(P)-binding protein [Streptomyces sp. NPDC054797]